jgi:hypothetical protein
VSLEGVKKCQVLLARPDYQFWYSSHYNKGKIEGDCRSDGRGFLLPVSRTLTLTLTLTTNDHEVARWCACLWGGGGVRRSCFRAPLVARARSWRPDRGSSPRASPTTCEHHI